MAGRPSPRFPKTAARAGLAAPEREARIGLAAKHEARRRERVMRTLAREIDGLELPAVEKISDSQKQDPFQILISTLLSARTQDATTLAASTRLFARARTPQAIAKLGVRQIEKLIYPVGFYRNKAVFVRDAAKAIIEKFDGRVPARSEERRVGKRIELGSRRREK